MITARIIALAIGYILGTFQTGYFYAKIFHNVDIRQHGSGNTGSTNTLRTLGKKAGYIAFFGDAGKSILAVALTFLIFREKYGDGVKLLMLFAAFGSVMGHNYPFYLGFKGGKGVACTAGTFAAVCPYVIPICGGLFYLILKITGYVSLGSLLMVSAFFIQILVFNHFGIIGVAQENILEYNILAFCFVIMVFWRHRSNIQRLMNGTENSFKKK